MIWHCISALQHPASLLQLLCANNLSVGTSPGIPMGSRPPGIFTRHAKVSLFAHQPHPLFACRPSQSRPSLRGPTWIQSAAQELSVQPSWPESRPASCLLSPVSTHSLAEEALQNCCIAPPLCGNTISTNAVQAAATCQVFHDCLLAPAAGDRLHIIPRPSR